VPSRRRTRRRRRRRRRSEAPLDPSRRLRERRERERETLRKARREDEMDWASVCGVFCLRRKLSLSTV